MPRLHPRVALLVVYITLAAWAGVAWRAPVARADDGPAGVGETGFKGLVDRQQRDTLRAVVQYVEQHPEADDVEQAYQWMFETSLSTGMEADAAAAAEAFLKRRDLDQGAMSVAQQVLCVGLAKGGKLDEATGVFEGYLRGARFQSPFRTLDLAGALAAQARIAGNLPASRDIYERVAATYPLNAQIGEIVEGRIARQELIGKPAPRLGASDLEGKPIDLTGYAGKVVLIDFWATNCAPCIAEFPNLRQLYKEYHEKGFEIVGVSFDDGPAIVEAYRARAKLPWRMAMNEAPEGQVSQRYKTRTIPALFLVDKQGNVAQCDVRGGDLRRVVDGLLKK